MPTIRKKNHSKKKQNNRDKTLLLPQQESTDGSWIEAKEASLVWHYRDADPDFGNWQAKELLDHLEGVLSNMPAEVAQGAAIVEVKPQGASKGAAVEAILSPAAAAAASSAAAAAPAAAGADGGGAGAGGEGAAGGAEEQRRVRFAEAAPAAEFVLCVGDDRSDEDMFLAAEAHGAARGAGACRVRCASCRLAALPPCRLAALLPCRLAALPPCCLAASLAAWCCSRRPCCADCRAAAAALFWPRLVAQQTKLHT